MLALFIQSIIFLCIPASLSAMHPEHIIHRDKVHEMLYAKYQLPETEIIPPVPTLSLSPLPKELPFDNALIRHMRHYIKQETNFDAQFIERITAIPASLTSKVISHLTKITFPSDDPRAADIHHIVATLHYKNQDYEQAHAWYNKNEVSYLKTKKAHINALKSYLLMTPTFTQEDITYLSSLAGNLAVELKKIDTTNPQLSYKVGLATQAFLAHNPLFDITKKTDLLLKVVHHLEYAQKNSTDTTTVAPIAHLTKEFYIKLSTIYETKNDTLASLKYIKKALESCNDVQDKEIMLFLTQAAQENPSLCSEYTPWINIILHFMYNNSAAIINKQENHLLLDQFAQSKLCLQLLPYIQKAYDQHHNNSDIALLLAKVYQHKREFITACTYIDAIPQPSQFILLLKSSLYTLTGKTLSKDELTIIFNNFNANPKPSFEEQEIVTQLISYSTIENIQYPSTLALIAKLTTLSSLTPACLIHYVFSYLSNLSDTQSILAKQWDNALNTCSFYKKIGNPSEYDESTNAIIGTLLYKKEYSSKRILPYLTAAFKDKENKKILPDIADYAQELYVHHACTVASTYKDHTKALDLFDQALLYDTSGKAQYGKAIFILDHSNDKELVALALELLERNISENNAYKTISQVELARAYLNNHQNPARIPFLKSCIAYDIDKALSYLTCCSHEKSLLLLLNILTGNSSHIPDGIKEKYIDLTKALVCANTLISNNQDPHKTIDYLGARLSIHSKLNIPSAALNDINLMLNHPYLVSSKISKNDLLNKKIELLLTHTELENNYQQALQCAKQLTASCAQYLPLNTQVTKLIHEYVQTIINTTVISEDIIAWACIAADAHIMLRSQNIYHLTREQERNLAEYLLQAAKSNHINALFLVFLYLNETEQLTTEQYFLEGLYAVHRALFHPQAVDHQKSKALLVNLLEQFVEKGYALPCYILCDYYKDNQKELEKVIKLFSKADKQHYFFDDSQDAIKIQCKCKDALMHYATAFMNPNNKRTLLGALATFTIGSMLIDADTQETISGGIIYITTSAKIIHTHKLIAYINASDHLLSRAYYKQALLEEKETKNINVGLLAQSALLYYFPAARKLAQLWLEQQKNKAQTFNIKEEHFLPMLLDDIQNNNPCHPDSLKLYQEYLAVKSYKANPTFMALKEILQQNNHATIIEHSDEKEQSEYIVHAMKAFEQNNNKKAVQLLEKASLEEHNPVAGFKLAETYIKGKKVCKNYALSNLFLYDAVLNGISTQHIYNIDCLYTLCTYIQEIITQPHPRLAKQELLTTIKEKLEEANVAQQFYTIFSHVTKMDLLSHPDWIGDKNRPEIKILTTMMKNLYKEEESSESFEVALISIEDLYHKGKDFIDKAAFHYPLSCLRLALQYLMGRDYALDHNKSACFLAAALSHGITDKKCCNKDFLKTLYIYLEIAINQPEHASVKKQLLSIIKNALIAQEVNLSIFQTIFTETAGIKLASIKDWMDHHELLPEQDDIETLIKNIVRDHDYQETPLFQSVIQTWRKGDMKKTLQLAHQAAKENHPAAYSTIASSYLSGKVYKKNYKQSEEFLYKALRYGLAPSKVCNEPFLDALSGYLIALLKDNDVPKHNKQQLLAIIKNAFLTNNIDLSSFCKIVKHKTDIDLSSEWK